MGGATRFFVLLSGPLPLIHHRRSSFLRHASHYHKFFRSSLQPSARILSSSFHSIRASRHVHSQVSTIGDDFGSFEDPGSANSMFSPDSYTWREWSQFLGGLISGGYFGRQVSGIELVADLELPAEFLSTANACLAFSPEREHLLGLLPRKDIEVLVESVSPCFFRDGDDSSRKMKLFLRGDETQVLDHDKAHIIDLFKFILSYARNPTVSSESNLYGRDLVESSVRNLLREICQLGFSNPDPNLQTANQFPDKYGLPRGPYGPKIEMKRGDWICPRCSFMNFARNVKCLECDEARPKRQLNGGEWECPQCDFFNYGRNTLCLRCDCRRPGAPSVSNINENFASGNDNGSRATKVDIDSKLAANEEKAQRWFSKISQLDGTSDSSSSIADEDFPEIMPLRKGVNRFVVSTRKTPLERRLANAQYKGNLGNNDGVPENNSNELSAANNSLEEKIGQRLDDIFGRTSPNSQSSNLGKEQGTSTNYTSSSSSGSLQYESLKGSNSNYVPFVPLPPDMFAKKPTNSTMESKVVGTDNNKSLSSGSNEWTGSASQSNEMKEVGGTPPRNETEKINEEKEDAEKSERWFKRVAELHNVTDLPSAISDEDFPEIMPIRKGENRFVVSKKKDRSLTSPAYKRHAAEQSGSSNFVPFVPFPPDYFAKKDKPSSDNSNSKATGAQSNNTRIGVDDGNNAQQADNQETQTSRFNSALRTGSSSWNSEASSSDYVKKESNHNASAAGNPSAASEVQNIREKWSGKSLEGSAVTEPDPLDMSEEAKAQRWFRRVAQIKDISELSQIPDEDFPSIMPMRQGVNRFVVSKRKTPLERRLTSPQYRRNLPIVSSDPPKRENDDS